MKTVTILVCGTMKTMVLVPAHVVSEKSRSPVRILHKNLQPGCLLISMIILKWWLIT